MELLRLRRRLALARKGHRLLKGKQDELVRRFFLLLEDYFRLRQELHGEMALLARKSRTVRLGAIVALRKLAAPEVRAFLQDSDELVLLDLE